MTISSIRFFYGRIVSEDVLGKFLNDFFKTENKSTDTLYYEWGAEPNRPFAIARLPHDFEDGYIVGIRLPTTLDINSRLKKMPRIDVKSMKHEFAKLNLAIPRHDEYSDGFYSIADDCQCCS